MVPGDKRSPFVTSGIRLGTPAVTTRGFKENETNLTKGSFFFDRNKSVLFYDISFPEKQVQYNKGNKLFVLKDKKVINSSISEMPIEFTVFSLALSQKLVDYGLSSNGSSKLEKVEKENDLVYNSWVINSEKTNIGKVVLCNKGKTLTGAVFLDKKGNVLRKQFFKDYNNYSGLMFPSLIIDEIYINKKPKRQITNFKNIRINETNSKDPFAIFISQY
jgi:hypothetical protein